MWPPSSKTNRVKTQSNSSVPKLGQINASERSNGNFSKLPVPLLPSLRPRLPPPVHQNPTSESADQRTRRRPLMSRPRKVIPFHPCWISLTSFSVEPRREDAGIRDLDSSTQALTLEADDRGDTSAAHTNIPIDPVLLCADAQACASQHDHAPLPPAPGPPPLASSHPPMPPALSPPLPSSSHPPMSPAPSPPTDSPIPADSDPLVLETPLPIASDFFPRAAPSTRPGVIVIPPLIGRPSTSVNLRVKASTSGAQAGPFPSVAPLSSSRLTHGFEGNQFPADSEPIWWPALGVDTYLPWASKTNCKSSDATAVKRLKEYPNATDYIDGTQLATTMVAPLVSSTDQQIQEFHARLNESLANGLLVVVRGWRSEYMAEFSAQRLEEAGCAPGQIVCVHGTSIHIL
jgi:hypothetical protein